MFHGERLAGEWLIDGPFGLLPLEEPPTAASVATVPRFNSTCDGQRAHWAGAIQTPEVTFPRSWKTDHVPTRLRIAPRMLSDEFGKSTRSRAVCERSQRQEADMTTSERVVNLSDERRRYPTQVPISSVD